MPLFLGLGTDHIFSLELLWDRQQQGSLREAGAGPGPSFCSIPSQQDSPHSHHDPKARLNICCWVFTKPKFPKGKLWELWESLAAELNFHSLIYQINSPKGGFKLWAEITEWGSGGQGGSLQEQKGFFHYWLLIFQLLFPMPCFNLWPFVASQIAQLLKASVTGMVEPLKQKWGNKNG